MCTCSVGYIGPNCDVYKRQSTTNPCQNNGLCSENGIGGYVCYCLVGWFGSTCGININYCSSNPCKNGKIRTHN